MDDKERAEYESYQKSLHDQASAYESTYVMGNIEGHKEGKQKAEKKANEKLKNMVESLLKSNVDKEIIKLSTGLTDKELANLTNQKN